MRKINRTQKNIEKIRKCHIVISQKCQKHEKWASLKEQNAKNYEKRKKTKISLKEKNAKSESFP